MAIWLMFVAAMQTANEVFLGKTLEIMQFYAQLPLLCVI
jgi:hypothetical protein